MPLAVYTLLTVGRSIPNSRFIKQRPTRGRTWLRSAARKSDPPTHNGDPVAPASAMVRIVTCSLHEAKRNAGLARGVRSRIALL